MVHDIEAARLRALATACRDLARTISYRPDRDIALAQARSYDEAADRLEHATAEPSPIRRSA